MVLGIFYVPELNKFEIVIFATALCTVHNMKPVNGGHCNVCGIVRLIGKEVRMVCRIVLNRK